MAKISKNTINNLREFMSRGCEYSGTQEIVNGLMNESLREMGAKVIEADNVSLIDWDDETIGMLDDFANIFWDKAVETFLNVLATENIKMSIYRGGTDVKGFPIINTKPQETIPWSVIEPHAEQAKKNHGQTLERLAERCGLSWGETCAVLENRSWRRMDENEAKRRVLEIVNEHLTEEYKMNRC